MSGPDVTRRRLLWLAPAALHATLWPQAGNAAGPSDQGIGGTGFSLRPAGEDGDRGIGGTGVIGTIRKFGSIIVNDLRISYPKDVRVRIDGRPATAAALKIGQVVQVTAQMGPKGALSTHLIDVTSEVAGPVEWSGPGTLLILGQTVSTAELASVPRLDPGAHVAVSGLRRPDGVIVASLIEPAPPSLYKTAGPVLRGPDGALRIGNLKLNGIAGAPLGERLIVEGHPQGPGSATLLVTKSSGDVALFPAGVKNVSLEAYVEQGSGGTLRLGSGQAASGQFTPPLPAGRPVRAVLTGIRGAGDKIRANGLRSGAQQYRAQRADGAAPPQGQRSPMDFGQVPQPGGAPYANPPLDGYYDAPAGDPGLPLGRPPIGPGGFGGGGFGGGGFGGRR